MTRFKTRKRIKAIRFPLLFKSFLYKTQMSDNALNSYIKSRQEEELALLISLSNKRRKLIMEESGSREAYPNTSNNLDIIRQLAVKCKSLYTGYSSLGNMEKCICYLAYNSIIYLSEDTKKFMDVQDTMMENFKESNDYEEQNIEFDEEIIDRLKGHLNLKMSLQNKYYDSLKLIPLSLPGLENQSFRIYSRWLEEFVYRQDVFSSWKNMSEQDIVSRYYEPVFSTLFEGSRLVLKYGETENNESKEAQKIAKSFDNGSRGALKVYLRICCQYEGKYYDVCNVEFARNGDIEKKCVSDAAKVMLEGKCILDQIVKIAKLDNKNAKELQVLNLQFCGLKGTIIGIRFEKNERGYITQNIGRTLRMPTGINSVTRFFETMVPSLLIVKERAEKNAALLEAGLNKDNSSFGSQSPKRNCTLLKATWLGPKASATRAVPPLPQDFL